MFMTQNVTILEPREAESLIQFAAEAQCIFAAEQARTFWGDAAYTANALACLEKVCRV
jgi:hypothetical protein